MNPTDAPVAIAADDVAAALADYVIGRPLNRIVEIAGPEAGVGPRIGERADDRVLARLLGGGEPNGPDSALSDDEDFISGFAIAIEVECVNNWPKGQAQ